MKLLAVETATGCLSVAVLDGARVMARADKAAGGQHAKYLIPTIDQILTSLGLTLADLGGLAVSIGPGSFTGIRVGLATVMGFRTARGLPLATVPTLEAMAWNLRPPWDASVAARSWQSGVHIDEPLPVLCPILRARTGEVFWALYQWTSAGMLTQAGAEQVGSLESMATSLHGPALVYGEGWETNKTELRRIFKSTTHNVCEGPPEAMAASAVSVGLAGLDRLDRGDVAGLGLSPRYVQRAEAEIMRERRATLSQSV